MLSAMVGKPGVARPGYWFPLLVSGGLGVLSLPLSVLGSPRLPTGINLYTGVTYPTVTEAMYLGGGFAYGPFPFPLGWYWAGALVAGLLLTAGWCRWRDRRAGGRTPLRGYLVTGLVLAAVTAALPLLAWGTPMPFQMDGPGMRAWAWAWLNVTWRLGTFALLAVAVGLGILARSGRSRALTVITVIYAAAVCFAGWLELRQVPILPAFDPSGSGDITVLLPATVLLLAGLGALLAAGVRQLRSRNRPE